MVVLGGVGREGRMEHSEVLGGGVGNQLPLMESVLQKGHGSSGREDAATLMKRGRAELEAS